MGGSNEMIEGLIDPQNDSITEGERALMDFQGTKNGFLVKKTSKMESYLKSQSHDEIVG
jgi:hypothetical protein